MIEIRCSFEGMGFALRDALLGQIRLDIKSTREVGFPAVAAKVAARAAKNARVLDKVFNGTFIQGWGWLQEPDGGTIVNAAPHAWRVEFGARPGGYVDRESLREWVRVKLFGLPRRVAIPVLNFGRATPLTTSEASVWRQRVIRSRGERAARRANRGADPAELESEAWRATEAIARKIEDFGTEPSFVFRDALLDAPRDLGAWVRRNLPFKEEIPF